jgi:hypothetical protein
VMSHFFCWFLLINRSMVGFTHQLRTGPPCNAAKPNDKLNLELFINIFTRLYGRLIIGFATWKNGSLISGKLMSTHCLAMLFT